MSAHKQTGLSMIELMVTLSVVAILAAVAAPNISEMIERNKVQSVTNGMVSQLYLARSEAAKRGFNVSICASNSDQTTCDSTSSNFNNGWLVFTDYNNDGLLTAATNLFDTNGDGIVDTPEEVLMIGEAMEPRYTLVSDGSSVQSITYRPTGQSKPRNFSLSLTHRTENKTYSKIYLSSTGRLRSCTVKTGDSC